MQKKRRRSTKKDERETWLEKVRFLSDSLEFTLQPFAAGYPDGRLFLCNNAFCELTGYTKDEVLDGITWSTGLTPPEWREREAAVLRELGRTGRPQRYEKEYIRKDGTRVPVELAAYQAKDDAGSFLFYYAFVTDITERRRVERELAGEHALLNTLLTEAPIGFAYFDRDLRYVIINDRLAEINGVSAAAHIGRRVHDIVPAMASEVQKVVDRILATGLPVKDHEFSGETALMPGVKRYWTESWYPIRDGKGEIAGFGAMVEEVTERKRVVEALKESEGRYKLVVAGARGAIWDWDVQNKRIFFSPQWKALRGLADDEVSDREEEWSDRIHPDDAPRVMAAVREHFEGRTPVFAEDYRTLCKDGSWKWISDRGLAQHDARGRVVRMAGSEHDISDRKRAEEALRDSEARLNSIFRAAPTGIGVVVDRVITEANDRLCAMTGYTRDELLGKSARILYPSDEDYEYVGREKYAQIKMRGTGTVETRWRRRDGRMIDVLLSSTPMEPGDLHAGVTFTALDITSRKQAEEALRESEEDFRAAFEQAAVGMTHVTNDGHFIRVNQKFCDITGYAREELLKKTVRDITYPPDMAEEARLMERMLAGELTTFSREKRYVRKDGAIVWVNLTVTPISHKGATAYLMGITEETTERKRAEEALHESEEKFRALAETSPAAIAIFRDGRYIYVNRAAAEVTGHSIEELMDIDPLDTMYPDDRAHAGKTMMMIDRGETARDRIEIRIVRKDGSARWMDISAAPISYHGKNALISIALDVTERKRAEEALKAAKSQAELYLDLMGHDINNIHQAAMGYLELARDMPGEGRDECLKEALEALKRSARLIDNVRKLQKFQERRHVHDVDVCPMLDRVYHEYTTIPGKTITLNLNGLVRCRVRADDLLQEVYANLVGNAVKHTGDGARISIRLDALKEDGLDYCRVCVEDDGPGITPESKETLFNRPLMGTPRAKGMGLGLYIVKTLVDDYGGRVWAEDRVAGDHAKGARFVVLLPAVDPGTAMDQIN